MKSSPKHRYFASITISAKKPYKTFCTFALPTPFWEPIWNRNFVDNVQITQAENFGVQGRGAFYEEVGAIRDVVQNHLLQVIALLAMDTWLDVTTMHYVAKKFSCSMR